MLRKYDMIEDDFEKEEKLSREIENLEKELKIYEERFLQAIGLTPEEYKKKLTSGDKTNLSVNNEQALGIFSEIYEENINYNVSINALFKQHIAEMKERLALLKKVLAESEDYSKIPLEKVNKENLEDSNKKIKQKSSKKNGPTL